MIFLDHNSTTKPLSAALNYAAEAALSHFENPSAPYAGAARGLIDKARDQVASVIQCDPQNLIFTSGGTESNNLALWRRPELGDLMICSAVEHSSVYNCCTEKVRVHENGQLNLDHLEQTLKKAPSYNARRVFAMMTANNETGVILDPDNKVPEICAKYNVALHIDAVQSLCKVGFDAVASKADTVAFSAHKIGGLKGTGALFIREGYKLEPLMLGGHHEFGRRPGTENQMGILAFGMAAELSTKEEISRNQNKLDCLRDLLERLLESEAEVNGSKTYRLPNTTSLYFPTIEDADLLVDELFEVGVAVSARSACTSGMPTPSRVLRAMYGENNPRANKSLRISLGPENTEIDIREVAGKIIDVVKKLKK